jgi:hypothetical protein
MYPVSLNLYLTSFLTAILIAITISTPIDNLNHSPTTNTTTSLALTQNITLSSAAPLNTTQWVISYCNKPFDPTTGACQGDCHIWKVAERGLDGPGDAPDTNCVFTSPPFQVQFKVCAGPTGWWHCRWDSAFHPWLYPDGDVNGVSVYNTISTGSISLGPDLTGKNT